ncbi:MAG: cell elongation-specific peptidoglycan D,D-transpeptidase [Mycobacterium sp.]|nr:cell elongation-specific peptidoglycan D,D-transpeptidase [Mycobacterium sp.]
MNRPIRRVSIACLVLMMSLLIADNLIQLVEAGSLRDKPQNSRQREMDLARQRGPIVVAGKSVAESVPVDDVFKYQRRYPGGALYAPVTGYFSIVSSTQVEQAENGVLSGTDNRLFIRRLSDYFTGRQPKGGSVELTLDPATQQAAAAALGNRQGAVVALDPKTGAILALVTSPSFDPNLLAVHNGTTLNNNDRALTADPAKPLLDRATELTYPPGSTFKLITAAAALSAGYKTDTQIDAPNSFQLPQSSSILTNFGGETCSGTQRESLLEALKTSCNTAFAKLGLALGAQALSDQAKKFGFDTTISGFPLRQAASIFPTNIDLPETALSAIGQFDVRTTPLQMAMVTAAIANDGKEMKPYVVKQTLAPDLSTLQTTTPQQLAQPIDGNVASQLTEMMTAVVNGGTGTAAALQTVQVAGKTGTAQNAVGQAPHSWFVGFAPVNDPQVAVCVFVENSGGDLNGQGGTIAAPIARTVMSTFLGKP